MSFRVHKVTLVADTPTEVYVGAKRSPSFKVVYVPAVDDTETCVIAPTEAALDDGDGWPITGGGDFSMDDLELEPNQSLWAQADAAGTLHLLET